MKISQQLLTLMSFQTSFPPMEHKDEFLKNIQAILVNEDWACQALKRHKRHKKSSK